MPTNKPEDIDRIYIRFPEDKMILKLFRKGDKKISKLDLQGN